MDCTHKSMIDYRKLYQAAKARAIQYHRENAALRDENAALRAERDALLKSVVDVAKQVEVMQPEGRTE